MENHFAKIHFKIIIRINKRSICYIDTCMHGMQMDMSDEYKRKQIKSEIYIWLVLGSSHQYSQPILERESKRARKEGKQRECK